MPDISTVAAFLGSVKTATELAKAIKGADLSIEKAELKLKMAELISALADAKIHAAEIQDILQEKDEVIKKLESLLIIKVNLVYRKGVYYKLIENEKYEEDPYCSKCWDSEQKPIHLFKKGEDFYECPHCSFTFGISLGSY